jgi:hypothetical protein
VFIVEDASWEVLLGRPLLKAVGIDVEEHLLLLAENQRQMEMDGGLVEEDLTFEKQAPVVEQVSQLMAGSISKGMKVDLKQFLMTLLMEYQMCFASELLGSLAADVEPLVLVLKDGANPIRSKFRTYSPMVIQVMEEHVDKMLKAGFIRENMNARLSSACYPVRKPGTDKWRITIDYRAVNNLVVPKCGFMPYIAMATTALAGMTVFV